MATRGTIKTWFQRGLRPTAAQFGEWIDSFVHVSDMIPQSKVTGLVSVLGSIISPGKDEACGAKKITYQAESIPLFVDKLDLSLEYREQVIEVRDELTITYSGLKQPEVKVVIYNNTMEQLYIGPELPTGAIVMRQRLVVDPGGSMVLTFARCVDGTAEYDPEDIQLRIY